MGPLSMERMQSGSASTDAKSKRLNHFTKYLPKNSMICQHKFKTVSQRVMECSNYRRQILPR